MNKNEFAPSADNYLVKNYILEYLNDSIQQLLEAKNTNPKVEVLEFFSEYFKSVKQGTHILFREYNFIISTPHNRACFVEKVLETFYTMLEKEDLLKICDYHSLVLLLCHDFPIEIIENSLKIINPDNFTACFKDFLYAFQFQLYYKEFINEAKIIYDSLYLKNNSESKINSEKFADLLENLNHKYNFSIPPKYAIRDATKLKNDDLKFNDFLKILCFHDVVTKSIDKIPIISQIIDYKKPNIKSESDRTEVQQQSTVTSSEYSRITKSATIGKVGKKSINNNKDIQSSRSTTSESSSDSDTYP